MTLELIKSRKREEMAAQLHFSYSQLNTYLLCPMKYAHSYVWGTPWESKSSSLIFGGAIHKSAEKYYLILKDTGEVIPVDQMIAVFETTFNKEVNNKKIKCFTRGKRTPIGSYSYLISTGSNIFNPCCGNLDLSVCRKFIFLIVANLNSCPTIINIYIVIV